MILTSRKNYQIFPKLPALILNSSEKFIKILLNSETTENLSHKPGTFVLPFVAALQPDCLDVGVLLPDVDLTEGGQVALALRVRGDLAHRPQVGVLGRLISI